MPFNSATAAIAAPAAPATTIPLFYKFIFRYCDPLLMLLEACTITLKHLPEFTTCYELQTLANVAPSSDNHCPAFGIPYAELALYIGFPVIDLCVLHSTRDIRTWKATIFALLIVDIGKVILIILFNQSGNELSIHNILKLQDMIMIRMAFLCGWGL